MSTAEQLRSEIQEDLQQLHTAAAASAGTLSAARATHPELFDASFPNHPLSAAHEQQRISPLAAADRMGQDLWMLHPGAVLFPGMVPQSAASFPNVQAGGSLKKRERLMYE